MSHISFPLFEKKQRRSGGDNDARLAVDRENVLYDGHGKPVLDKDGHPVYVDRELGQRPLLNTGDEDVLDLAAPLPDDAERDSLGTLPPEEKTADAEEGFGTLPPEEKTAEAEEDFGTLPPEEKTAEVEEGFGTLPPEEKTAEGEEDFGSLPPEETSSEKVRKDPLSRLLEGIDPD